jgi:hypothetical protein
MTGAKWPARPTAGIRKLPRLKRDEISRFSLCLSMIFSENRFTLFRIML